MPEFPPGCADPKAHRDQWLVAHRRHNHSRFHGGYQRSVYSEVICPPCRVASDAGGAVDVGAMGFWRTRAAYVDRLPNLRSGGCS